SPSRRGRAIDVSALILSDSLFQSPSKRGSSLKVADTIPSACQHELRGAHGRGLNRLFIRELFYFRRLFRRGEFDLSNSLLVFTKVMRQNAYKRFQMLRRHDN